MLIQCSSCANRYISHAPTHGNGKYFKNLRFAFDFCKHTLKPKPSHPLWRTIMESERKYSDGLAAMMQTTTTTTTTGQRKCKHLRARTVWNVWISISIVSCMGRSVFEDDRWSREAMLNASTFLHIFHFDLLIHSLTMLHIERMPRTGWWWWLDVRQGESLSV